MFARIVAVLAFSALFAFGAKVDWATDYKSAVERAKKENKGIFLMLSQPGCPLCKMMKEGVLKNGESATEELSQNFVSVEVNILKDGWNKKFRAFATPTFYILDKNENKIGRQLIGETSEDELVKALKALKK